MKILRTASLGANFTGSYEKKSVCNVTYRFDKIERLLLNLDYEVMDVTAQIFINFY